MKKFISKHAFWILQIIGCFVFTLSIYLIIGMRGDMYSQVIFGIGMFLNCFIPTTILRFLYKAFVKMNPFGIVDVLKIIVCIALIVLLMEKLPYYLGYILGWVADHLGAYGKLETDFKSPNPDRPARYIGLSIIITSWTMLYFLIKVFRSQYADRLSRLDLKDKIKQAQLNTLKGHINPQFMVNSLSNIKELMLNDVPTARKKLTMLSEILRYSLTKNNINSVPVEEEYETAKNYVSLLDIGTIEKHSIKFDLAPETLKHGMPPMLLTSLIEMATKHGIYKQKEEGDVLISTVLIENNLKISVRLNSKITRTSETNFLEKAIIQRLKLLFKQEAVYEVFHELNRTMIEVIIPQGIDINNLTTTKI